MNRRRQSGYTVLEFLVAGIVTCIIGGGFVVTFVAYYSWWDDSANTNAGNAYARLAVDTFADKLRNATQYATASNAVIADGQSNSITFYRNSAGDTTTIWLDTSTTPGKLKKTDAASTGGVGIVVLNLINGIGSSTTTLLPSVSSLTFTYYMPPAGNYTADRALWTTTALPNSPTLLELPQIGGVLVTVQTNTNGAQRALTTFVRLRGSPKKTTL